MTGLTSEVHSIHEALEKLYFHSIATYGKEPTAFIVGQQEWLRLKAELRHLAVVRDEKYAQPCYMGIPVVISVKGGIDVGIPESVAA